MPESTKPTHYLPRLDGDYPALCGIDRETLVRERAYIT